MAGIQSEADGANSILENLNYSKSIHALAREELAASSQKDTIRFSKFDKAGESLHRNLAKKYSSNSQFSSATKTKNFDSKEISPDEAKTKKLRQAQFELKKLKEEIARKNVEVLAMTKDLEEWDTKKYAPAGSIG